MDPTVLAASVFDTVVYGNSLKDWLIFSGIVILTQLTLWLCLKFLANRLKALSKRTSTDIDDFAADLLANTNFFVLLAVSIYVGSHFVEVPKGPRFVVSTIPILAVLAQTAFWGIRFINFLLNRYVEAKEDEHDRLATKTMVGPIKFILLLLFWSVLLLVALSNLGFNITALVAGLGVGGIAVALATQNILGDVFAALSIVLEKPFVIGDFIISGEYKGTVEHIGLKTTRIRSIDGEQIIFSNNDILQSRLRNYKRMDERRALFRFGVIYQTRPEQLEAIPGIVQGMIESIELTRFDRAHFFQYGPSSLDFEVVYYVTDREYSTYMDIQQKINLALFRRFEAEGIIFAYPTQTLYFANGMTTLKAQTSPPMGITRIEDHTDR